MKERTNDTPIEFSMEIPMFELFIEYYTLFFEVHLGRAPGQKYGNSSSSSNSRTTKYLLGNHIPYKKTLRKPISSTHLRSYNSGLHTTVSTSNDTELNKNKEVQGYHNKNNDTNRNGLTPHDRIMAQLLDRSVLTDKSIQCKYIPDSFDLQNHYNSSQKEGWRSGGPEQAPLRDLNKQSFEDPLNQFQTMIEEEETARNFEKPNTSSSVDYSGIDLESTTKKANLRHLKKYKSKSDSFVKIPIINIKDIQEDCKNYFTLISPPEKRTANYLNGNSSKQEYGNLNNRSAGNLEQVPLEQKNPSPMLYRKYDKILKSLDTNPSFPKTNDMTKRYRSVSYPFYT